MFLKFWGQLEDKLKTNTNGIIGNSDTLNIPGVREQSLKRTKQQHTYVRTPIRENKMTCIRTYVE